MYTTPISSVYELLIDRIYLTDLENSEYTCYDRSPVSFKYTDFTWPKIDTGHTELVLNGRPKLYRVKMQAPKARAKIFTSGWPVISVSNNYIMCIRKLWSFPAHQKSRISWLFLIKIRNLKLTDFSWRWSPCSRWQCFFKMHVNIWKYGFFWKPSTPPGAHFI